MLSVFLNFCYAAFICFCIGKGFSMLCGKFLGYQFNSFDSLIMAGMCICTVYAEIFSLFYKVGFVANIVLLTYSLSFIAFCLVKKLKYKQKSYFKLNIHKIVAVLLLIIVWTYCTSRGIIHYDTDLYHAQSIEWIEEYGVIKGIGNLHSRLAYNSSFFALSALFSMKFMTGVSLHAMNGLFALILSITCLGVGEIAKRRKFKISDFARFAAIYYLFTLTDEVVSPASDYATTIVIFFIVIKWLDQYESGALTKQEKTVSQSLLCVMIVYAMTLKLTTAVILLLVLIPAIALIKAKAWKQIAFYIICGIVVLLPWIIRTVLISGWLIYPFSTIDIFNVDWKIPKWLVEVDSADIKSFAKGLYNGENANAPINYWFKNWFANSLSTTEKLFIAGDLACIPFIIVRVILTVLNKRKKRDKLVTKQFEIFWIQISLICSFAFWLIEAPMPRYGYAYMLLPIALMVGWCFKQVKHYLPVFALICAYGLYKLIVVGKDITVGAYPRSIWTPYYIWQMDYNSYETANYKIDGITIYYPLDGDRVGYSAFPSSITLNESLTLRGDSIYSGFKLK